MSPSCSTLLGLTDTEKSEILREAYKKHAAELLAIESAQVQFTTLVLAIFGASATFLASAIYKNGVSLKLQSRIGLTIVVIAFMAVSFVLSRQRSKARSSVRGLIVNVEQALRFYEEGVFVLGKSLYPPDLLSFPKSGKWLGQVNLLASLGGIGILVLLWTT